MQLAPELQATGLTPCPHAQVPLWHEPYRLLAQEVLFGASVCAEQPVVGLHIPVTLHVTAASHITGFVPTRLPFWPEHSAIWEGQLSVAGSGPAAGSR